jgi:hypothetical protein
MLSKTVLRLRIAWIRLQMGRQSGKLGSSGAKPSAKTCFGQQWAALLASVLGVREPKTTLSAQPERGQLRGAWTEMVILPPLTLLSGASFGAAAAEKRTDWI